MEEWRPVTGYEGLYDVSNLGEVRSHCQSFKPRLRGDLLTPGLSCGRRTIGLYKDGKRTTRLIAHLVLEAFAGPRPPGQEACHGPRGSQDDSLANLSWGTREENQADRVRDGTSNRGERQWQAKLTTEIVLECRRRYAAGERLGSLAAEFGITQSAMSQTVSGARWSWLPGAIPVDRRRHGTQGAAHHAAKLTPELIKQAKKRCASGEKQRDVAAEYGVTQATLWKAIRGWTWKSKNLGDD
jgi:NUMOD4 motif